MRDGSGLPQLDERLGFSSCDDFTDCSSDLIQRDRLIDLLLMRDGSGLPQLDERLGFSSCDDFTDCGSDLIQRDRLIACY